jgi:alpha-L-rhamnosidase
MIDNGATTIWELWNGNTADPAMNSGNHVMLLGDLLVWYYENLAGIQTDKSEVGFKKIVFNPVFPKGLSFVRASHKSPYGLIKSEWNVKGNSLTWKVAVPANTTAEVHIPAKSYKEIKVGGASISESKGFRLISEKNKEVLLGIPSGEYTFELSDMASAP